MRFRRGGCFSWLAAFASWSVFAAAPHTRVDLILSHTEARVGETVTAGVRLRMDPGWHTYWVNPGDSGGATTLDWTLPDGITAGEVGWPVPEPLELAGLTTYVYHGEVTLLVPLRIGPDRDSGPVDLRVKVSWLECAETCLPGDGVAQGRFMVGANRVESESASALNAARTRVPRDVGPDDLRASWDGPAEGEKRWLSLEWRAASDQAEFLPLTTPDHEVAAATESAAAADGRVRLRKEVTRKTAAWPSVIQGVLVERRQPDLMAYAVTLRPGTAGEVDAAVPGKGWSLGGMLLLAFLGGVILNIMPCVLPVIALKVLSFVRQSQESAGTVRRHGLLYGAGVLISFAVLAGGVVLVQQAGKLASWGMQFQSAGFLLAMTVLVTLVALNLFGVFEVTLGGQAMGAAAGLASREGPAGAFFNGVLATALATPCTAPVLGTAVGFAFAQPPAIILLMFLFIGLGLASPYVVLSFVPGLARFLPRPGAWMERFKVLMGFPMLGAAIWLLSLLGRHFGPSGVLWVGVFMVIVALSAWVWGQFVQHGKSRKPLAALAAGALVAAGYGLVLEGQLQWRTPRVEPEAGSIAVTPGGIGWEPWSPAAVQRARAEGLPVLVDFTADWCFTCQANKKTSLEIPAVVKRLRETGTVALLGDYTLKNDAITQELRRYARAGVPLVLVYPKAQDQPPKVLPELLTPSIVLDALDQAAK